MTDDTTQETTNNLEYIGSFFAGAIIMIVIALICAVALGIASLGAIPQAWFVAVVVPLVIMAAIQLFGEDVYNVFKKNK